MAPRQQKAPTNDTVWARILKENPKILQSIKTQGFFDIESSEIKEFREPRLACKIDFKEQVPKPLLQNELSVLAIRNGLYRIAPTNPFVDVPELNDASARTVSQFSLPSHIKTLSPTALTSEAKALDAALISGMLDFVFQDNVQMVLRGYERSSNFNFSLPDRLSADQRVNYEVEGVQIEVDGGYEGQKGIYLVEAKNRVNNNINIRQLLYPQLHYNKKFGSSKAVRTYLMLYDQISKLYHFLNLPFGKDASQQIGVPVFEPQFLTCQLSAPYEEPRDYWQDLTGVPIDNSIVDDDRPFPQADDFSKILALLSTVSEQVEISLQELFIKYSLDPRQYDYYANAIRWLRLADYNAESRSLSLSVKGKEIMAISSTATMLFEIAKIALSNDIFNQYVHAGPSGVTNEARYRNRLHSDSTFYRRLSTVKRWLDFFKRNLAGSRLAQTS